jgi:acyl-CoA reductase-like NAD-dependent aldehyde dehydrogenase
LHKVAALRENEKTDLAKLITLEMGKIPSQAEWEVNLSADILITMLIMALPSADKTTRISSQT